MPKTIAVINMKGGVGKSTLTVNLGWYTAYHQNEKVLIVDLDPQFNTSQMLLGTSEYEMIVKKKSKTVCDIFENPAARAGEPIVNVAEWADDSRIDLIPSKLELAWTLKNPSQKEHRLARFLKSVGPRYDRIFIDCAPTESMLTTAAYLASEALLVPVRPEFLSTIGLPLLVRSFEDFKEDYTDHPLALAGIVFNCASKFRGEYKRSTSYVRRLAADQKWHVYTTEIEHSESYSKGARQGTPIFATSYARTLKRRNFMQFAHEFYEGIS